MKTFIAFDAVHRPIYRLEAVSKWSAIAKTVDRPEIAFVRQEEPAHFDMDLEEL